MFDPALGVVVTTTLGFVAGYLVYAHDHGRTQQRELNARIGDLLERVSLLEYSVKRLRSADVAADASPPVAEPIETQAAVFESPPSAPPVEHPAPPVASETTAPLPGPAGQATTPEPAAEVARAQPTASAGRPWVSKPSALAQVIATARAWLLGGNTVARVGVLVLFVGVAFLLRYVAERTQVPIELRLVGVALGAIALLAIGWRLRT